MRQIPLFFSFPFVNGDWYEIIEWHVLMILRVIQLNTEQGIISIHTSGNPIVVTSRDIYACGHDILCSPRHTSAATCIHAATTYSMPWRYVVVQFFACSPRHMSPQSMPWRTYVVGTVSWWYWICRLFNTTVSRFKLLSKYPAYY